MKDGVDKYDLALTTPRGLVGRIGRIVPKIERSKVASKWFEQRGLDRQATVTTGIKLANDIRSMYDGYDGNSWDEPYLNQDELANWRDALVLRPDEYGLRGNGKGWGLVDHSKDSSVINKSPDDFLGAQGRKIAMRIVGSPPLAEVVPLLTIGDDTENPKRIPDSVIDSLTGYYQLHPDATLLHFRNDSKPISQGRNAADVGPLVRPKDIDLVETKFHSAITLIRPEVGRAKVEVDRLLERLVDEAKQAIDSPDYDNDARHRLLQGAKELFAKTIQEQSVYEVGDVDGVATDFTSMFAGHLPNPRQDTGPRLHKRLFDQGRLAVLRKLANMRRENRAPDNYGLKKIFHDVRTNRFVRLVPNCAGRALSATAKEVLEMHCVEDYRQVEKLPLFYAPTGTQLERLAFIVDEAMSKNDVLTIFVPTCPCDEIEPDDGGLIKFTGRSLIDGVSWTGLNTIDGLSALIPRLQNSVKGLKINLVFATGDFEWKSGSKRGMTEEDFMSQMTKNHHQLWDYLRNRWELKESTTISNPNKGSTWGTDVVRADLMESDDIRITVGGLMTLSGGLDRWDDMRDGFEGRVEEYFANEANKDDIVRLMKARRPIYESLQKGEKKLSDDELIQALKRDALDYCAAHMLSRAYPNSMVVAGDSRPMEELAASISGTLLFSIEGGYRGSKYEE